MKLKLRGATAWLPLLICVLGVSACGGSSGGGGSSSPPPSAPPPPPPPPPPAGTAPSALSYTNASTYMMGTALTPLDPTVTGTVTSYVVSPGFPAGITLDATTGKISGTPTAPAPATTYTVTASNATGSTTFDLNFAVLAALAERVTADRPDEKTDHQVHVIYALPSDAAEDEQLDQKGTIEESLRILNDWFALQTGGKELRFDTYGGGKLDVTFMKLARTDLQMQGLPRSSVRKELDEQLYLNGFADVKKLYLVYYGGDGEQCGRGAWPPTLQGNVAALYIGAASGCRNVPFAAGNAPPAFLEFLALHEMLHVLGFVPECAPNYTRTGHVSDSRQDVMFSSDPTGTVLGEPSTLDVNLDDYLGPSADGCLDLVNSAFLDPLPAAAEAPPTWPYAEATDLGCQVQHTPPATLGADTGIMFVNDYEVAGVPAEAQIYEVVPDPNAPGQFERVHLESVPYGDGVIIPRIQASVLQVVKEGAVYVVLVNGNCRHTVRAAATPTRFTIK